MKLFDTLQRTLYTKPPTLPDSSDRCSLHVRSGDEGLWLTMRIPGVGLSEVQLPWDKAEELIECLIAEVTCHEMRPAQRP